MTSAAPADSVPHMSPWARAHVAALVCCAALAGCGAGEVPGPSHADEQPAPAERVDCDTRPLPRDPAACQVVETEYGAVRYAKVSAPNGSHGLVVVDIGGPGISVLAGIGMAAVTERVPAQLADHHDLVVLEEPWVTARPTPACEQLLSDLYTRLRAEQTDHYLAGVVELDEQCDPADTAAAWSADSYRAAVAAISEAEETSVVGFIGSSFGSVRRAYLDEPVDWTILLRPFPAGAAATEFLARRAALISGNVDHDLTVTEDLPNRSLPVVGADWLAAHVAAAATARPPEDPRDAAALSDTFWQRFGEQSISHSHLAHWSEVCSALTAWNDLDPPAERGLSDVAGFLHHYYAPCLYGDRASKQLELPAAPWPHSCAVVGALDPVTPPVATSKISSTVEAVVESPDPSHHSADGLERCLDAVINVAAASG